ncbi:MAG: adenylosuccinate synthase [Flavobacteriaceae bacterium]|nr:adenylosuccinate synthase [Flavobacteriaceae bacterium]
MPVDVLLGLQWGDEGKGKIVDCLSSRYDIIARFQGGPNAGHSLEFDGKKHILHTIPSGIFHKNIKNLIGNGVVIDPIVFDNELKQLNMDAEELNSRLFVSNKAHLILPTHRLLDKASEVLKGKSKIGSTLKGIGPAYMDKTGRNGLRVGDLFKSDWDQRYQAIVDKHFDLLNLYPIETDFDFDLEQNLFFEKLEILRKSSVVNSLAFLQNAISKNQKILAEGAQGTLLDIDFGTYPYVTSSSTTSAGACIGLGISPRSIHHVYGISKAYTTRVGKGPFPTEIFDHHATFLLKNGNEIGATTGRQRRCGWLDLVALKYAVELNGVSHLILTKGDVLSGLDKFQVCWQYTINGSVTKHFPYDLNQRKLRPQLKEFEGWQQDISGIKNKKNLPKPFHKYLHFIENYLNIPVHIISVGPDRSQTIYE